MVKIMILAEMGRIRDLQQTSRKGRRSAADVLELVVPSAMSRRQKVVPKEFLRRMFNRHRHSQRRISTTTSITSRTKTTMMRADIGKMGNGGQTKRCGRRSAHLKSGKSSGLMNRATTSRIFNEEHSSLQCSRVYIAMVCRVLAGGRHVHRCGDFR